MSNTNNATTRVAPTKKIIYIAGAITGLDTNDVAQKFASRETILLAKGYQPVNPFKTIQFDEAMKGADYNQIMRACIVMLMGCDGILLLHDWNTSKGAVLERDIAMRTGIPIFYSFEEVNI